MKKQNKLWIDIRKMELGIAKEFVFLASNNGYEGVIINSNDMDIIEFIPKRMKVIYLEDCIEQTSIDRVSHGRKKGDIIVMSNNIDELSNLDDEWEKGVYAEVNDKEALLQVVDWTRSFRHVFIQLYS